MGASLEPLSERGVLEDPSTWRGTFQEFPLEAILATLGRVRATGRLHIVPLDVELHLREGRLQAVSGLLPLGDLLLRGELSEKALASALASGVRPLGQALLRQGLEPEALRRLLLVQAQMGVALLLQHLQGQAFAFYPGPPLPEPGADLELGPLLLTWARSTLPLPLGAPVELAPSLTPVALDEEEWRLIRLINGRRTLANVLRFSGLEPQRAWQKAEGLIGRGLIRPSALFGLRLVVPSRPPRRTNYHPPSSLMANLFLKWVDGERTAAQIGTILGLSPHETALYLVDLYREGLLEVRQGRVEMERLLGEF
ncbi:hypothetical protein FJNA_13500 [Thermus sp. FJN-A]